MAMVVNTNVSSLIAQSAANATNKSLDTAMERLATGKRINSAADDAAGVAIASRLEAEIRGVNQAVRNAADAQAMIDTAEGAHIEITNILQRMREIAVQSSNDSNNDTDRGYLQNEVDALANEVDRIANTSTWAGKNLIKTASIFKFLLGSEKADNEITVSTNAMTGAALGIKAGNAIVGAQGATLTETGNNVLQVGGTPAAGDVYKFDINGDKLAIQLFADQTDATLNNFDYKISTDDGATYGGFQTAAGAEIADKGTGSVAAMIATVINAQTGHAGLTATAATDGSVTLIQNYNITGDAVVDGGTDTTLVTVTSATTIGGVSFAANENYTLDLTGVDGTGTTDEIKFTINGVELSLDGAADADAATVDATFAAQTAFSTDARGHAAALQALVDANADKFKGFTIKFNGASATSLEIGITHNTADMIKSPSTVPYASSTALDVNDQASAANAINTIDTALDLVNSQRAALGAVSNRMDSAISNLTNMSTNLAGGKSRIEDADFASETAQLTKSQILQQAATSMLAQANASKQSVLSLLQG
jgi:flagellin